MFREIFFVNIHVFIFCGFFSDDSLAESSSAPSDSSFPSPPFGTLQYEQVAKSYHFSLCSLYLPAQYFSPLYLVNNILPALQSQQIQAIQIILRQKLLGHLYSSSSANSRIKSGFMPRIIQSLPAPFHSPRLTFQGLISCKFYPGASLQSQKGGNTI